MDINDSDTLLGVATDLRDVLVRSRYQFYISYPTNDLPQKAGSGFIIQHRDRLFLITAGHVVRVPGKDEKYPHEKEKIPTIPYYFVAKRTEDNVIGSVSMPLPKFDHFDKENKEPFDMSFCELTTDNVKLPLIIGEDIPFSDGYIVKAGSSRIIFQDGCGCSPSKDSMYFVFGNIQAQMTKTTFEGTNVDAVNQIVTLKEGLKYKEIQDEYIVLETEEKEIPLKKDWAGLSGSPVIDDNGYLLGVLSSISKVDNTVFVIGYDCIIKKIEERIFSEQP